MATDLWLGAATTLIGAALGGSISFAVSRQQIKSAWMQREADATREQNTRSEERRFAAYSEFITRARSCRNALGAHYLNSDHRPTVQDLDVLLYTARDASTLVFLVLESEATHDACRAVLRALGRAEAVLHGIGSSITDNPWTELNQILGSSTRTFQNAVRAELGVSGPTKPWTSPDDDVQRNETQQVS